MRWRASRSGWRRSRGESAALESGLDPELSVGLISEVSQTVVYSVMGKYRPEN